MSSLSDIVQKYPPEISDEHAFSLLFQIQDWQLNHSLLLKLLQTQCEHNVLSSPISVAVFPTPFPKANFEHALSLQTVYNELYCALAEDEEWIYASIKDILPIDTLAAALWDIHEEVKRAGYAQDISAGIFRSDYMLHIHHDTTNDEALAALGSQSIPSLKQVEFNTFSCAGASHANKVANMHHHIVRTGAYDCEETGTEQQSLPFQLSTTNLPRNNNIETLATSLASAHSAYGGTKSKEATETGVLFIVQPDNFNTADERPIEYALWNQEPSVPTYRLDFTEDVLTHTTLTESRELLYRPPWQKSKNPLEISVVYMRAGYEAEEYDDIGKKIRLRLELSRAIKCPSILAHICTFKKIQHALTPPGVLERFLTPEKAMSIRETFVQMLPLDGESDEGRYARSLVTATDRQPSKDYILKPSLEGGGHNIYGEDIPKFLASVPESKWAAYILMRRIPSPHINNILMTSHGIETGGVISELGVLGTCLWRRSTSKSEGDNNNNEDDDGDDGGSSCKFLENSVAGWTLKTKRNDVNEMSVVKGYGCFDTPLLV